MQGQRRQKPVLNPIDQTEWNSFEFLELSIGETLLASR